MASDSEPLGEPVRDEYEVEIQEIGFERPDVFHYCKSRWKKIAIGLFFGSIGLFILCMVLGLGIRFVEEDEFATLTYPNVALINTSTGAFRGISNAGAYSFLVGFTVILMLYTV